jgi:hypothetical protein
MLLIMKKLIMMNLKVSQDLTTMLVEQLARLKSRASPYFEPLPQLKPSMPSQCAINIVNVQPSPICGEEFYCYDICIVSCNHTNHPWCLVAFTMSSRKCKGASCEKVFQKDWCTSFRLLKFMGNLCGSLKEVEGIRDVESPQMTSLGPFLQLAQYIFLLLVEYKKIGLETRTLKLFGLFPFRMVLPSIPFPFMACLLVREFVLLLEPGLFTLSHIQETFHFHNGFRQ